MTPQPLTILLAEDDDGHATLVRRGLRRAGVENELIHVRDGLAALDHVRQAATSPDRPPRSLLLLLDINMPRANGFEVLGRPKASPLTASVPVIILTTTREERDIERCYRLGCSVFVTKPVAHDAFMSAVERLGLFLQIIVAPRVGA